MRINNLPVFQKIKAYATAHKLISVIIIAAALLGAYMVYARATSTSGETRYILGTVTKSTLIASVSASGQVSASTQLDVKSKVSGDIVWVGVKAGDTVYTGEALASIDNTDGKKAVTNAEQSLAEANLQYQKDSAQAPIDYQKAQDALASAKEDLATTYVDTFNTISNAYLDLPPVITGIHDALFGYDLSDGHSQWNVDTLVNLFMNDDRETMRTFATSATNDYATARSKYDASILEYKQTTRYATGDELEKLLGETIDTATAIAQSLQSELNLLSETTDLASAHNFHLNAGVTSMQTNARTWLSTTNTVLNDLLSQKKAIETDKQGIKTDEQNITLLQVGNASGSNPISLQISRNSIQNQEDNLVSLNQTLADYTVRAPFSGTIAAFNVKVHDSASSGTTIATLITTQKIATLSLNEVDAAKIKVGDKATLTFDAIDGLSLTGSVAEIDPVGTVSQGVVSYNVKIAFDTQNAPIKPGMTANASIITDVHQDVLMVPASAIRTVNGTSVAQVFSPALPTTGGNQGVTSTIAPQMKPVEVGISNDSETEIISGLSEGDQIVTRTITASQTTATAQSAPSLFGGGTRTGGSGGGGNAGNRVFIGR